MQSYLLTLLCPYRCAQKQDLAAGATFAVLVLMKHLFAYVAPLYFVYLLRHYCFVPSTAYVAAVRLTLVWMSNMVSPNTHTYTHV